MNGKILIVDDSKTQLACLAITLESEGFDVIEASNGEEAWEIIQNNAPDLVLTDIIMPKLSGFDLCRRIKSDIRFKNIPVVLLTALASVEDLTHGLEVSCDYFIQKQTNKSRLLEKIGQILNQVPINNTVSVCGRTITLPANTARLTSLTELLLNVLDELTLRNENLQEQLYLAESGNLN